MTTRLCTAPNHDRPPVALGELLVCEDHHTDIVTALTGPSAAADPTIDAVWGIRDGQRVCGDGHIWYNPRDYRPARIARDYAALGARLTGQTTGEHVSTGGHGAEAPLPLDTTVAELRVDIHRKLATWAQLHAEEITLRASPGPDATVAQLATWLAVYRDKAAAQPWAGEYAEELRWLRRRARRLIDLPLPRRMRIAPCPERVDGQQCGGSLFSVPREERDPRPVSVACDECGATFEGPQFLRLCQRLTQGVDLASRLAS